MPEISAANAALFEQPLMTAPEHQPNLDQEAATLDQANWRERIASFAQDVVGLMKDHPRIATGLAVGATALGAAAPASANTIVDKPAPTIITTTTYKANGVKISDSDMSKVTVGAYFKAKGISKSEKRKIIKAGGRCYKRKVGTKITNSLVGANGKRFYYPDKVKAGKNEFCKDKNGREYMVKCKNRTYGPKPPQSIARKLIEGKVIAIRSWNKGSVAVSADSKATVDARCETSPGNYAAAHGEGSGHGEARLSWRQVNTAKGRNIVISSQGEAIAEASSSANASADTHCSENTVTVITPGPEVCPPGSTKPECVPPVPGNRPPTGRMNPVDHLYENEKQHPICVDDISDPDGDPVKVVSFDFRDTNNQPAGQWDNGLIFTQSGGAQCVNYNAGGPGQVTVSARLSDGRGGYANVNGNFPVLDDDFGGN